MGLAASQARFLAITARKADCEFRSMQIAQNKLSVTREMEQATQDYQNAINATKMVWDYDGKQTFLTDISYGFLMTPSYLNNFNPYLVTDRGGRVIVDSKIAAAARAAGIDDRNGGARNPVGMYKFLEALAGQGVIADSTKYDVEVQIALNDGTDDHSYFCSADELRMARYNDDKTMNEMSGLLTENEKKAFYSYVASNGIYINGQNYTASSASEMKSKIENLKVDGINKYMKDMTVGEILEQYSCKNAGGSSSDKLITINGVNYVINGNNVEIGGKYSKIKKDKNKDIDYLYSYDENAGYGSMPMSKNEYVDTGILGIVKKLRAKNEDGSSLDKTYNGNMNSSNFTAASGTFYKSGSQQSSVTLSDILSGNVCYVATYNDGAYSYTSGSTNGIHDEVSAFLKDSVLSIARILHPDEDIKDFDDIGKIDNSLYQAYYYTAGNYGIRDGNYGNATVFKTYEKAGDSTVANETRDYANKNNTIAFGQNSGEILGSKKWNSSAAVNLSNLLSYFLTAYDNFTTGWESNYITGPTLDSCLFVTQDPNFRFAILSDKTETNEAVMKSDFYMQLYNNLCINGYVEQNEVKDDKYLEQMLKNGLYFLCGVNDQDGYFYQARYSDDIRTLIKVVNDEDAKTRAESEYSYQKARLTAKEDRLDLEMKNIDMEIAALTSEYDSVKNLISKGVEKTFKQFES